MRPYAHLPVALLPLLGALWLTACSSGGPAVQSADAPPQTRSTTAQSNQPLPSAITDELAARREVTKDKRERDKPAAEAMA